MPTRYPRGVMSTVTVQLGQCGNQIGTQLFSILHADALASTKHSTSINQSQYKQATIDRFFTERDLKPPLAKAVLIDMETKVIQSSISEAKKEGTWLYDTSSTYRGRRGSGNNWANGFYQHGPQVHDGVLEIVRKEVEKCDYFEGFLILMSVAGGTGSGMGTYITELLNNEYPSSVIINPVVWPYASGEVIVQNYNALLTIAHLSDASDAIILLLNDHLHSVCSKLLMLKEISFTDLNRVASHAIASILQPAIPYQTYSIMKHTSDSLLNHFCSLGDFCTHLTPHPSYRLLTMKCVPQMPERSHAYTHYLWPGLLKYLRQMLITDSPIEEGMDWSYQAKSKNDPFSSTTKKTRNKALANLVIVRGKELDTIDPRSLSDSDLYCDWVPESMRCAVWCSNNQFNKYEKSCTIVSNNGSCLHPLTSITEKAWRMYSSRAYVHQYIKFGLSEELFMEGFVKVEQILKNYTL